MLSLQLLRCVNSKKNRGAIALLVVAPTSLVKQIFSVFAKDSRFPDLRSLAVLCTRAMLEEEVTLVHGIVVQLE